MDASRSMIFPLFRKITKRIICAVNPNRKATRIVITLFRESDSRTKANIVKTIIVNDGGTKRVEIILASLSVLFICHAEFISASSAGSIETLKQVQGDMEK